MTKEQEDKKKVTTKKLQSERNKYFVPNFGEIEADSIEDAGEQIKKLQEKQEVENANI